MRFELNITMQCNLLCANCNRLCDLFPQRSEHMSPDQIYRFVEQLKESGKIIQRLKIVGGEPLLHPEFKKIYEILVGAAQKGLINNIQIDSNRQTKRPNVTRSKYVRWGGRRQNRKRHIPPLWSPHDHGVGLSSSCEQIRRCGYSLDKYGYLPCSVSIMLVRLLGLTHLYRREFPIKPWGLDEICAHCSMGMDYKWKNNNAIPVKEITSDQRKPSATFERALKKFNLDEFHRTQIPF